MTLLFEQFQQQKPSTGEWRCRYENYTPPSIQWFRVLRHTPQGMWVEEHYGKEHFILKDARKQWAWETEEEAVISYLLRKFHQKGHLKRMLKAVDAGIGYMQKKCPHNWQHYVTGKQCILCDKIEGEIPDPIPNLLEYEQ